MALMQEHQPATPLLESPLLDSALLDSPLSMEISPLSMELSPLSMELSPHTAVLHLADNLADECHSEPGQSELGNTLRKSQSFDQTRVRPASSPARIKLLTVYLARLGNYPEPVAPRIV